MKILHVITSLYTGGAEKLMVDLLPRVREQGHHVELCAFDGTRTPFFEQLEKEGIKIHWFHEGGSVYNPLNIYRLWCLMRKGWDIVHTHNTAPQLFAAFGGVLCSVVLVTTEHNTSNRRRDWKWYAWLDRWMFRQYGGVICISDQAEINHCKHMGADDSRNVCTIYNGVDYHKYAHAIPAKDIKLLGGKIITNVAGFRYQKDQPTLIKAMTYLPDAFHLCLVGDGERRGEFEALIEELNLTRRVHLLGLRSDVPEVLAASDYVVMCSHFEGLSLSSLEGMSSGKAFLADDVDGLREIVKGNGVLFEHEDSKGFADAIMKLDCNAKIREQIVKQCQAKAFQYDINVMTGKYLNIYKKLLNK